MLGYRIVRSVSQTEGRNNLRKLLISLAIVLVLLGIGYLAKGYLENMSTSQARIITKESLKSEVISWMKNNLKDPDSVQYIEWSDVGKTADGYYSMNVKYRAKNSFNAFVIETMTFKFDTTGAIVSASPHI
jgi:hypothetical protein